MDTKTEVERRLLHISRLGPDKIQDAVSQAIAHLDVSRTARKHGDNGSAEGALTTARELLLGVLGIEPEIDPQIKDRQWLDTACAVIVKSYCGKRQFKTPSGDTCEAGHGGAPGIERPGGWK